MGNTFKLFIDDGRGFLEVISNGNTILLRLENDIDTNMINEILMNYLNQNIKKGGFGVYS